MYFIAFLVAARTSQLAARPIGCPQGSVEPRAANREPRPSFPSIERPDGALAVERAERLHGGIAQQQLNSVEAIGIGQRRQRLAERFHPEVSSRVRGVRAFEAVE